MKLKQSASILFLSSVIIFSSVGCSQNIEKSTKVVEKDSVFYSTKISQDSVEACSRTIPLNFEVVSNEVDIIPKDKDTIREIYEECTLENEKYLIYVSKNDTENLHSGVQIGSKFYDLGKVSMMGDKNSADLYSCHIIKFNDIELVKITGILGANTAETNYYYFQNGVPKVFLHTSGDSLEIDLDGDKVKEIVSSYGTAAITDVYKYENSSLLMVNLNEALNAEAVLLSETDNKTFAAYFKARPNQPTYYEYTQQGLKQVK